MDFVAAAPSLMVAEDLVGDGAEEVVKPLASDGAARRAAAVPNDTIVLQIKCGVE